MDPTLDAFISDLGNNEPLINNIQMNEMLKELEDYFDKALVDVDEFINEILSNAKPLSRSTLQDFVKQRNEAENAITILEPVSREVFVKSFATPITVYSDLIPDLKLDIRDNCLIRSELILASIRQKIATSKIEHPRYATTTSEMSCVLDPNIFGVHTNEHACMENDMNRPNDPETSTISENTDWIPTLQKQNIHPGITVDVVVGNIMRTLASTKNNTSILNKSEINDTVQSLFLIHNKYIDGLTVEFANNNFFDDSQLKNLTHKLYEDALSSSNVKMNQLLQVLDTWMKRITEDVIQINNERRQIEQKISKKVIQDAVNIYKTRLASKDIIRQGILRAYSNCGSDFKASIQRDLEKRLDEIDSNPEKSEETSDRNEDTVGIQLHISEYLSNISQKGLQCASISTLQQFDDVNKNCLADIMRNFEKHLNQDGQCLTNKRNLKEHFQTTLEAESKKKRSEYEQKLHVRCVSGVPKSSTLAMKRLNSVGIHFGFESLSVVYFDETRKAFKSIYGPSPNSVCFAPEGIFIGGIPKLENVRTFDMKYLLTSTDLNYIHHTINGDKWKLVEIIASILMQIHQITKQSLHTMSEIRYSIAIPSCLNKNMQNTFANAMKIGLIEGNLVREQCALTANFIHEKHDIIIKHNDDHLIVLIENSNQSCDCVAYELVTANRKRKIEITCINGFDKESGVITYFFEGQAGVNIVLDKIFKIVIRREKRYRFIICCQPTRINEIAKLIRTKFLNSEINRCPFNSSTIATGAALLSSIAYDDQSSSESSINLHSITSIQGRGDRTLNNTYRLKHYGFKYESPKILQEISKKLNLLIENQSHAFASEKAKAKQFLMGKTKDLEQSQLPDNLQQKYHRELENNLKEVEGEMMNIFAIKRIVEASHNFWF